jgi:hypothetical protein
MRVIQHKTSKAHTINYNELQTSYSHTAQNST